MIIKCFRCDKGIDTPGLKGEIIDDKPTGKTFYNADYIIASDTIETIIEDGLPKEIQKTGIICPDCYKDTDSVIWGAHK